MPPTVYIIDPIGDTVIRLRKPCRNFATWEEVIAPSSYETAKLEDEFTIQGHRDEDEPIEESGREPEIVSGSCHPETEEIHYLVSSRHLMLASQWFMRMLTTAAFKESVKNPEDGLYHINAEDWDEEAFLILLNIFHLRDTYPQHEVSTVRTWNWIALSHRVSLEMLAKIAVLVDYYGLGGAEVMERELKSWINAVRQSNPVPRSYCRDLMLWICVAQVFSLDEEFDLAKIVAAKGSQGHIQSLGLPISDLVIGTFSNDCVDLFADCD
jgi:hypothetical protein